MLYYRSSATTSSRMHEQQAVDYTSQCTPQGHVSADSVWTTLANMCFSKYDRTINIMKRFCHLQTVPMHHHNRRRPMPSRQSTYHRTLMHDAPHNRRFPDAAVLGGMPTPETSVDVLLLTSTPIETRALECVFFKNISV